MEHSSVVCEYDYLLSKCVSIYVNVIVFVCVCVSVCVLRGSQSDSTKCIIYFAPLQHCVRLPFSP